MTRMYSVPEQGQPFRFHDLCGMAEFVFHLRMAYETLQKKVVRAEPNQPVTGTNKARAVSGGFR